MCGSGHQTRCYWRLCGVGGFHRLLLRCIPLQMSGAISLRFSAWPLSGNITRVLRDSTQSALIDARAAEELQLPGPAWLGPGDINNCDQRGLTRAESGPRSPASCRSQRVPCFIRLDGKKGALVPSGGINSLACSRLAARNSCTS